MEKNMKNLIITTIFAISFSAQAATLTNLGTGYKTLEVKADPMTKLNMTFSQSFLKEDCNTHGLVVEMMDLNNPTVSSQDINFQDGGKYFVNTSIFGTKIFCPVKNSKREILSSEVNLPLISPRGTGEREMISFTLIVPSNTEIDLK